MSQIAESLGSVAQDLGLRLSERSWRAPWTGQTSSAENEGVFGSQRQGDFHF